LYAQTRGVDTLRVYFGKRRRSAQTYPNRPITMLVAVPARRRDPTRSRAINPGQHGESLGQRSSSKTSAAPAHDRRRAQPVREPDAILI